VDTDVSDEDRAELLGALALARWSRTRVGASALALLALTLETVVREAPALPRDVRERVEALAAKFTGRVVTREIRLGELASALYALGGAFARVAAMHSPRAVPGAEDQAPASWAAALLDLLDAELDVKTWEVLSDAARAAKTLSRDNSRET
jgi:hypothetical protein